MLARLQSLWRNLTRRDTVDRDLDDEVRAVFEILVDEKVRGGLTPADELFFLIGQDAFDELSVWHRLEDVVEQVIFIVAPRPHGLSSARREGIAARASFQRLEGVDVPVSATAVRKLAREGSDIRGIVPDAVAEYIRRHRLYKKG